MHDDDLTILSLAETAALIRRREASAVDVVLASLRRIDVLAPQLHCFVSVLGDRAVDEARDVDAALVRGNAPMPLAGVPISVKDNISVRGVATTVGSPTHLGAIAIADATSVRHLRAAGAVIIATTNMWEFACTGHNERLGRGATANPWDLAREPGGSSSGSGASVAAGLGYASIATDGGGSIRVPAAMTGIVGMKPTFGRVDTDGVISHLDTLEHVGPMARTAEDAALVLDALSGDTTAVASLDAGVRGLRIGELQLDSDEPVRDEVRAGVLDACRTLVAEGARGVSIPMPPELRLAREIVPMIARVEAAAFYGEDLDLRADQLDPGVRRFLESGRSVPAVDYAAAQRRRSMIDAAVQAALAEVDVLILPTSPWPARRAGEHLAIDEGNDIRYTAPFNVTGHPAVAVPCGFDSNGVPLSMQIVGRPNAEALILCVAHAYQRVTGWHRRRPPLP